MKEILEEGFVINPEFYGMLFSILLVVAYSIYLIEKVSRNTNYRSTLLKKKEILHLRISIYLYLNKSNLIILIW